jgi:hypothetical protein
MILTDYPGHLVALTLAAGLAVLTVAVFHAPEVRTPARAGYGRLLMLLQYAAILLLLLILWNPSALRTRPTFTTNTIMTLFDTSESMSIADGGQRNRLDQALERFTTGFRPDDPAGPRYQLYGFDRHAYHCGTPDLLRRWGDETNLHAACALVADQIGPGGPDTAADTPGGAILFTDGGAADRDIHSYLPPARKDMPVLLVGVGSAQSRPDLAVQSITAPARAWIDTAYPVTVALTGTQLAQDALTLELLRDQVVIEARKIRPDEWKKGPSHFETTVEFKVPADRLGTHVLTARVPPHPDEVNTANNLRSTSVGVTQEQTLQVLLYARQASFDVGKLRQALAWDRRVRCDFRLDAICDPALAQRTSSGLGYIGFPQTREELYRYDVVVLGACDPDGLTAAQWEALHAFVAERGGGLLLLPGPAVASLPTLRNHSPDAQPGRAAALRPGGASVEALSPVLLDSQEPRLWPPEPNTIGRTFEAQALGLLTRTFASKPDQTISPYYNVARVKPAATTLAAVGTTPVISVQRIGRGRVGLFNASKLFKLYREDKDGGTLADCVCELAAYLGRTPSTAGGIELFAERTATDPRRVQFSAYVVNEAFKPVDEANVLLSVAGQVLAMQPAGEGRYTSQVDLGDCESIVATAQAEAHGTFLGERIMATNLPSLPNEMSDTDFDETFLRALAQRLGARYVHVNDLNSDALKTFVAWRQAGTVQQVRSLWPNWPLLLILCLLLSAQWFIRRSIGLV